MRPGSLIVLSVLLLPTVQAELALDPTEVDQQPIEPLVDLRNVTITGSVACTDILDLPLSAYPSVTLEMSPADSLVLTGARSTIVDRAPCDADPMARAPFTIDLQATVTRDAEAFTVLKTPFTARLEGAGPLAENTNADGSFTVVPGFFGLMEVRTPQRLFKVAPGGEVHADLEITSFSNGPLRVQVAYPAQNPINGTLFLPEAVIVEPGTANQKTLQVQYEAPPGPGNDQVLLTVTGESSLDPEWTVPPAQSSFLFSSDQNLPWQGTGAPGTQPMDDAKQSSAAPVLVLAVAFLALAWATRRRA